MSRTGAASSRPRHEPERRRNLSPVAGQSNVGLSDGLAKTGEYSIFGLTRAGEPPVSRERRASFALIIFAIATVVAVLYSLERYFYRRLLGQEVSLGQLVPAELIFTYLWALLTPLVMWMGRRFPVWGAHYGEDTRHTLRNWVAQLIAVASFVFLHVALFTAASLLLGTPAIPASRLFTGYLASWFTLDSIVYCTLLAVYHALVYYRVSQDRALRASQLEARLAQAQLQVLRMQLQPHFLFNTLHTISALMHRDVKRADSMIAALSDLLRMSLRSVGVQEVELREELEFLQRYLEIMSLRFGDRLTVTLDIDPNVLDARVPTLVLQPLVENSFRHGFGDGMRAGQVRVTVVPDGDMLRCEVVDNGRGIAAAGAREGVGTTNTRARLRHLYGERFSLELTANPGGGARVSLAIPYHSLERTAAD
ncbi:MAG TPA: sensor histidine kinase [Gemmatimonadaceae bacterium]|nr:sensor histidine kinase [Gemmatimonadaceae bacterium]